MGIEVAIASAILSTGLSTIGAVESAKNQKSALNYQADISDYQADVADVNAQMATEEGRQAAQEGYENKQKQRVDTAQFISQQRSAQSASGALLDSGSLLDVNLDTAEKGEIDALKLEQQGFDEQYKYNVQAQNFFTQSDSYRSQASAYRSQASSINPALQGATTLLGSGLQQGTNIGMLFKK